MNSTKHPRLINGQYLCICGYSSKDLSQHRIHLIKSKKCLLKATIGDLRWLRTHGYIRGHICCDWIYVYKDPWDMRGLEGKACLMMKLSAGPEFETWRVLLNGKICERKIRKVIL